MKNTFFLLFFMLFLQKANAQHEMSHNVRNDSLSVAKPDSLKVFQKVKAGIIFGSFGKFALEKSDHEQPFQLHEIRLANVGLITRWSYHEVMYDMASNGYVIINGYFFGKKVPTKDKSHTERLWDVYLAFSKEFASHHKHFALGVEKKFNMGDVNAFPFLEFSADFEGHHSALLGVLVSYQFTLFKRGH
ncbi:MAG: hypothetical protein QG583_397 [Patescibacteria group bacterium]|nr:hypothetical protein [Patescibacteria group bacterium]